MQSKANIIFIHKGNHKYLYYALKQARTSNPEANIYLIGDESNNKYDFITHHDIEDYFTRAESFAKNYQHLSTNSYNFELFCIQRWFTLNEFVKKNNINQFFHADSDILIYTDIAKEFQKFKNYDFTLSDGTSGHDSFWLNVSLLDRFCNFVEGIYSKQDVKNYSNLMRFYGDYKQGRKLGGVCDMTLLNFYKNEQLANVGEMTDIVDGSTYDTNISSSRNGLHYFKSQCKLKKVIWKDFLPYGELMNGQLVKFNTLHLQGYVKKYIKKIINHEKICSPIILFRDKIYKIMRLLKLSEKFSRARRLFK